MFDPRFISSEVQQGSERFFSTVSPKRRTGPTREAVYEQWWADVIKAEVAAGRRYAANLQPKPGTRLLTAEELLHGVQHRVDQTPLDAQRDELRRKAERVKRSRKPDERSPEQRLNDELTVQIEKQEIAKLTPLQAAKLASDKRLAATEAAKAEQQAREDIANHPRSVEVRENFDRLIDLVKYDSSASQRQYDELLHQRDMLAITGDFTSAEQNLKALTADLFANITADESALKEHADLVAMRKATLLGETGK